MVSTKILGTQALPLPWRETLEEIYTHLREQLVRPKETFVGRNCASHVSIGARARNHCGFKRPTHPCINLAWSVFRLPNYFAYCDGVRPYVRNYATLQSTPRCETGAKAVQNKLTSRTERYATKMRGCLSY